MNECTYTMMKSPPYEPQELFCHDATTAAKVLHAAMPRLMAHEQFKVYWTFMLWMTCWLMWPSRSPRGRVSVYAHDQEQEVRWGVVVPRHWKLEVVVRSPKGESEVRHTVGTFALQPFLSGARVGPAPVGAGPPADPEQKLDQNH